MILFRKNACYIDTSLTHTMKGFQRFSTSIYATFPAGGTRTICLIANILTTFSKFCNKGIPSHNGERCISCFLELER